jgi:3-methylcrotonyl-CoA carboxylase alpha subunit
LFSKILIANRGEIACRIASTARRLGMRVVAVYSEADANARHVSVADEAYCVGPAAARDSYLKVDAILDVAKKSGAQAIHPGYGFLSENEDFAEACEKAGLVFIGPPASAIRAMGSKAAAKSLMEKAGVPLVPGYHGSNQDGALLQKEADRIGYPVLIKASAGGGGKGMRVVTKSGEFAAALASCQREAKASFGDDRVLIEKYLQRPRHIEIQVFADKQGRCVSLFERDCSVQRRHQKVLEEAPAPGMTPERRRAMGDAAVAAAQAVGYVGAGTVEFIVDQGGDFYFMEMNTRLQVEHPVTEMITGQDLVKWQFEVAAGCPLPPMAAQGADAHMQVLAIRGHAIEARVYAENPDKQFLPSTGTLLHLRPPRGVEFSHHAQFVESVGHPAPVRVDAGVRQGDAITPFYDPMIAKLIVWGDTRDIALSRMRAALADFQVVGVATNIDFLGRVLDTPAFASGDVHTGLIEDNAAALFPPAAKASELALAAAAMYRLLTEAVTADGNPHSPWSLRDGWQPNLAATRVLKFKSADESDATDYRVPVCYARTGLQFDLGGWTPITGELVTERDLKMNWRGEILTATIVRATQSNSNAASSDMLHVFANGTRTAFEVIDPLAHAGEGAAEPGSLSAPMPGRVTALLVEAGTAVKRGTPLMVLEAMKMEHTINAPIDGVVTAFHFKVGDQVGEGATLATIEGVGDKKAQ